MKLLWCDSCYEVVKIDHREWRKCKCGKSGGQYNQDLVTATIGGVARVFGIANNFFSAEWWAKTQKERVEFRYKWYPEGDGSDCWWGDYAGERQLFHIESPDGPRLVTKAKLDRSWKLTRQVRVSIVDDRSYIIDGKKRKSVAIPVSQGLHLNDPTDRTIGEEVA